MRTHCPRKKCTFSTTLFTTYYSECALAVRLSEREDVYPLSYYLHHSTALEKVYKKCVVLSGKSVQKVCSTLSKSVLSLLLSPLFTAQASVRTHRHCGVGAEQDDVAGLKIVL